MVSTLVNNTNILLVIGKMMGVLVVKAHSGTLGISICPPVRFEQDSFYAAGEAELNELNRDIEQLEIENDHELAKRKELTRRFWNTH